jgi:hypothetical protein
VRVVRVWVFFAELSFADSISGGRMLVSLDWRRSDRFEAIHIRGPTLL